MYNNSRIDRCVEMRNIIINEILIPSIVRLYDTDFKNILYGVTARNICARLAHHMENLMRRYDEINSDSLFMNYFADVEYNRMGDGKKKYFENSLKRPQYMVSDLLIQSRGPERNYLAVEMKRYGTYMIESRDDDRNRLCSLVSSQTDDSKNQCVHDTLVGAFIVYSCNNVIIELYENVNNIVLLTDILHLVNSKNILLPYRSSLETR